MDKVTGWYNCTRSTSAHRFEDGYPLCQESDVGELIPHEENEKFIEKICEGCRGVINSRVKHSIRQMAKKRGKS